MMQTIIAFFLNMLLRTRLSYDNLVRNVVSKAEIKKECSVSIWTCQHHRKRQVFKQNKHDM
jgi:hypothetical protein